MADIKKTVNVNVKTTGAKKATAELNNLNDAINKNGKNSRTLDRNIKGNAAMSANASKNFSKQAQGMQGVLVPAYAEVAARVFALTAAYNALVKAADFSILLQGQQLYAERTGRNLGIVAKQLQEASGFMLDFADASRAAGLSGTAGLTTDQMVQMTKAARTASIALGVGMEDAFSRLTRGIVKGEPEILDEIGVLMRLDKVYADFGLTINKTANQLTESEKLQARFAFATGQIATNMGDLSSEVDSNPFAKIGAQSRDALIQVGSVLAGALKPVANFFDEFKEGIYLVMALVTRSLIGKIFPAFEKFGEKLKTAAANAETAAERSRQAFNKADAEYLSMAGRSAVAARGTAKTRQLMTMQGFKPGAGVQRAVEDRDLKGQLRSLEAAAGRAQAQLDKPGGKLDKRFQIQSEEALRAVQLRVKELKVEIQKLGTTTSNAGKGIVKYSVQAQAGWNSVKAAVATYKAEVIGAAQAAREAVNSGGLFSALKGQWTALQNSTKSGFTKWSALITGGLTALGSSVTNMLGKGLSIFSAVSMAGFLIDSVIGASKKFSKSSAAAKSLKDSIGSVVDSLNKGEDRLDLKLAATFTEAVGNVNFKSNLATQLSDAFSSAMKQIEIEEGGLLDATAKLLDGIKSIWGSGMADVMAESFKEGMSALNKMGAGINDEGIANALQEAFTSMQYNIDTGEFFTQIDRGMLDVINRFKAGIATFADVQKAAEELDEKGLETISKVLEEVEKKAKRFALAQKEIAKEANDSQAALSKLSKAFADLGRDMTRKTGFDALRDGLDEVTTSFGQLSIDSLKFQKITEVLGGTKALPEQMKGYYTAIKDLEKAKKELANAVDAKDTHAENIADMAVEAAQAAKEAAEKELRDSGFLKTFKAGDFRKAMIEGRFGGQDPAQLVKDELNLIERQAELKREIALYDKTSITATREAVKDQIKVLQNEKKLILAKEDILRKEGKLNPNQEADFKLKRFNLEQDILLLQNDQTKQLEIQARLRGYEVTQVERIANTMNKMIGTNTTEGMGNALRMINLEILIKQGELLAEQTRKTAEIFKNALDSVASSFKSSMEDAIKSYALGEEGTPFRESLGKGLIGAGAAGLADVSTKAVLGRKGLLGKAAGQFMDTEDPNSLFNQIFPKSQEEILQEQLVKLQELKNDLISGNWKFNESVLDTTNTLLRRIERNTGPKKPIIENTGDAGENSGMISTVTGSTDDSSAVPTSMKDAMDKVTKPFTESIEDTFKDITKDFDFSFEGLEGIFETGVKGFGEVFTGLDKSLGGLFGMQGGLFGGQGGIFGSGGLFSTLTGGIGSMLTGANSWLGSTFSPLDLFGFGGFFADGGIAKGGFRAYANGGIATKPHLGVVGEGKYNEAIVPLPDGKSIPVIGNTGGNNNNVTVNVTVDSSGKAQSDTEADGKMGNDLGYMVSQAVQRELIEQQRPGGLLNQYG